MANDAEEPKNPFHPGEILLEESLNRRGCDDVGKPFERRRRDAPHHAPQLGPRWPNSGVRTIALAPQSEQYLGSWHALRRQKSPLRTARDAALGRVPFERTG